MEALFRTVLNMSGTGAVVICALLLLRLLLKRAPKRYSYWLWSAALFRLVCPVSWKSVFSIFALLPRAGTGAATANVGAAGSTIESVLPAAGLAPLPRTEVFAPSVSEAGIPTLPAAAQPASADPVQTLLFIGGLVWLIGIAAMLIWGVASYVNLLRRLRTAMILSDGVWQSDAVDSPFLLGFFRPRIYIPFGLEGERLDYVLAHECFHIGHCDHIIKMLAFGVLTLHWFNPLVWLAFLLMGRDMEMRCDESVLGRGAAGRRQYSETLLSFAAAGRFPGPGPLAFGESGVKARIKNALRWKRPALWVTVLAAALVVVGIAACAANPKERPRETEEPVQTQPPAADATVTLPGAYTSVEGYLRTEIMRTREEQGVNLFSPDGAGVHVDVTQTEIVSLQITGTLDGLAPEGQLQSWRYRVRMKLPEDAPAHQLVGAMREEDGWLEDGAHDLVALVYPNERMDVLYDFPVNDGFSFYGYHLSYEEAIYDWYITAKRLDLPLYVTDWGAGFSADGNYPVHRYDGDGWYIYIPISGWTLTEASEARTKWTSDYDTGSTLVVREISAEELEAERPALVDGQAEWLFTDGNGRYWILFSQYDPKLRLRSSWVAAEPGILQRMAESFRVGDPSVTQISQFTASLSQEGQVLDAEVNMLGETFVSQAGEAGNWKDVIAAFAERWCEKYASASADSPYACFESGIWEAGNRVNAVSMTHTPRRLAFNAALILSPRNETAFVAARVGWAEKAPDGRLLISTEAVLVSDDDVHWTVESLNTGGTGGWGYRHLPRADEDYYMREILPYILSSLRQGAFGAETNLIQFVPNLDWSRLSAEEFNAAAAGLRAAAVKTEELDFGENDQLYRDLYMLWGFKNADGAYAELFLDGPDSPLATQYRADPETFERALTEMDAHTRDTVRRGLGI